VPAIDAAVCTLYASGYLHNHARMWLASYLVHLRKVHWRAGADWLYSHLLDGDLASNHLSWQWVAGTGSSKPYLFNAENVARHAPPSWHSPGSVIDTGYAELDVIARQRQPVEVLPAPPEAGIAEPVTFVQPAPRFGAGAADGEPLRGRHVWLVHAWSLREPLADVPADAVRIGVLSRQFHRRRPWTAARWDFVLTRMRELCDVIWFDDDNAITAALAGARTVQAIDDPHLHDALACWALLRPVPRLFGRVEPVCRSFSQWWTRATRGLDRVADLPGMGGRMGGELSDGDLAFAGFAPILSQPSDRTLPDAQSDLIAFDRRRSGDRGARWHRP
jgi:deoxyribodipyrimidine photo-lyase